jgi:hypothetical protein
MDFVDYVLDFVSDNEQTVNLLINRALDLGIQIAIENKNKSHDVTGLLKDMKGNREKLRKLATSALEKNGGQVMLRFSQSPLFRVRLDGLGNHTIDLIFMEGKATDFFTELGQEVTEFRKKMLGEYSDDEMYELIELCADFLARRTGAPFSYTVVADGIDFLEARLEDEDLNLQLLDPLVYLKTLLFLIEGANFLNVKLTSPFDMLKLFERTQGTLRRLANSFKAQELLLNAGAGGETIFTAGRDVTPNFTTAFGPIYIKLDSIFKIMSGALANL